MIKQCNYDFPSPYWDDISDMAKDLIKKILVANPSERLTAEEIYNHPWVVGDKTPRNPLPMVTDKIKEFNTKRRFRVSIDDVNDYRELHIWSWLQRGSKTYLNRNELIEKIL